MQAVVREVRLFFIALQFLTRIPVPRWVGFEASWLRDSARHFPAVGLCIGGFAALVFCGALLLWPVPVAVGLSMIASVWLTGAFHEDGLADTCDALGGAVGRERALEIMKDSRIGSYAGVGLVLVLGLKAVGLSQLPVAWTPFLLVWTHAASRAAAVLLMRGLPYVGEVGASKARPLAQRISRASLAGALAWTLLAAVGLWLGGWLPAVTLGLAAAGAALAAAACAHCWRRRLGGITGDTLGATQQIAEVCALLGALASARWWAGLSLG